MKMTFPSICPYLAQNRGLQGYLLFFAGFLLFGAGLLCYFSYGELVLLVNHYSRMEWDRAVDWTTRLGLGSTAAIIAVGLSLYKFRYGLMMLCTLALTGIFTALFKWVLFPGIERPLAYFEPEAFHRMVRLYDYNLLNSFPSGHTMTIFAVTSLLAYFAAERLLGILLLLLACLVGLTRIYLCQHFFVDVYFGAILGLACCFTTIWLGDYVVKLRARNLYNSPFLARQIQQGFTAFFW